MYREPQIARDYFKTYLDLKASIPKLPIQADKMYAKCGEFILSLTAN
jgi:hypothetical protein